MQYVARFTFDPQYDIQRNWSAWWMQWDSEKMALRDELESAGIDATEAYEQAIEAGRIDEETTLIDFMRNLAEREGIDIRYHNGAGKWMKVHHEGLSCFALEADNDADALAEAATAKLDWAGFGMATVGNVRHVGAVEGVANLHVFVCDRVIQEG